MSAALAFFRNPTPTIGVLCEGTFEPLTLHGVKVSIVVRHGVPSILVGYEYKNQTAASQKVFAAFPVPNGWRLLSSRADASMGNNFVRTLPPTESRTPPATQDGNNSVATLTVPWSVMVGQYVVVQATFLAPAFGSSFTIPKTIFPQKVVQSATANGWRGAFTIQAPSKFPEGCAVSIEGTAAFPLSGLPEINKGNVKVSGTLLGDPKGFRITASLGSGHEPLTEDLTIRFPFKQSSISQHQMQLSTVIESNRDAVSSSNAYAVVTTLSPSFSEDHLREPNAEFIFVLGLGNGISSEDVANIKEALHSAFAGLPSSCNVNAVCCTGSQPESDIWLARGSVSLPVTSDLLGPAGAGTAFLNKIAAYAHSETRDGIVVRSAMKRPAALVQEIISAKPFVRGLARNIVLITTDGGDTRAEATSQMVLANRHSTSVSAVALSYVGAADIVFLSNLANISNGVCVSCESSETVVESVLELVGVLAVPALTQINIHYTDSNTPSADGSTASSVVHCGVPSTDIPFIRCGSEPQWLYAFANASVGQLTVKVEGLIGQESMQYVVMTPKEAIASTEQSSCTKGIATSMSAAHLAAAALRQDQLILSSDSGASSDELLQLTRQFAVPTYKSRLSAVDESGVVNDDCVFFFIPNPLHKFLVGRKGALSPDHQDRSVTVVSTTSRPYGNVATDKALRERLVRFGEEERRIRQAKAQRALEDRKRREKAIGIDDQEAADAVYANEQLQIDSIPNTAAVFLGGESALGGGSTLPSSGNATSDFFRRIIEQLVSAICQPTDINKVLQLQQTDGSMSSSGGLVLASLGVTSEVLSHIPSALANKARAEDIWVTIIALARVQNDPRSILFQRKARAFLAQSGVEPDQHEAHAQHVLASS